MTRTRGLLVLAASLTLLATGLVGVSHASTNCLPNPGAACGWSANNYGGSKIFGDPAPHNGTQDTLSRSNWDKLHSFKNRSYYTACPMNYLGGTTWEYLDLLLPLTNYATLPAGDNKTDAVWFGVSAAVEYCS